MREPSVLWRHPSAVQRNHIKLHFTFPAAFYGNGLPPGFGAELLRTGRRRHQQHAGKCGKKNLNEYLLTEKADVLISLRRRELMCETLDYVDFKGIKWGLLPKWYMGYSVILNLPLFLLTTLCDTASIYGPCWGAFGMEPRMNPFRMRWIRCRGKSWWWRGMIKWEKEAENWKKSSCPLHR